MTAKLAIPSNAAHHLALEEQRWLTALRAHRKAHRQKAARRDEHLVETLPPPPTPPNRRLRSTRRRGSSAARRGLRSPLVGERAHELAPHR